MATARKTAGRPVSNPSGKKLGFPVTFRVNAKQKAMYVALGGGEWVRARLDAAITRKEAK